MMNFELPKRESNTHKGSFGKVLNISGSNIYSGAAFLSTLAILRSGAGYVVLASEKEVINITATRLSEAIYIEKSNLHTIKDFEIFLFGCGLLESDLNFKIFKKIYALINEKKLLIDAGGFKILKKLNIKLNKNCIITPHPKEAAFLLDVELNDVLNNLENTAKELYKKFNCIVVLKTSNSIVYDGKVLYKNNISTSTLSKAGTGDTLSGIITGLLSQDMDTFEASKLGVYLHSRTGEILEKKYSKYSVLASDISNNLHFVIQELAKEK